RAGVRLAQRDFAIALLHDHGGVLAVLFGQQHDGAGLARRDQQCECRDRNEASRLAAHSADTTNSVPRTPRIADGVRTVMASGDCFAIRPEMTESDPFCSAVSKRPLFVVGS